MKITRRFLSFLAAFIPSLTLFSSAQTPKKPAAKTQYFVYVGTSTAKTTSKGIYAYRFDASTGRLAAMGVAAEALDPSFLAIHPSGNYLYAVNEVGNFKEANSGAVSAYAIDRKSGKLTLLNQVVTRGAGPCHVSLDKMGKYVLVANCDGGSVASFPVLASGRLGAASGFAQLIGSGQQEGHQKAPHATWIGTSPDNRLALTVDQGLDEVLLYRFDPTNGSLTPNNPSFAKLDPGAGPRHLAFTPNGELAYVVSELTSTITGFTYRSLDGALSKQQSISTLPPGYMGRNDAAEIVVHPSGRFLYVSNRGNNSLTLFWIFSAKGMLTRLGIYSTGGKAPGTFAIDPTGKFLLTANRGSHNIVVFRIDPGFGTLSPAGQSVDVPSPVCITFVPAE
jgi:6-phosphogluconolactonase